MIRMIASDLDKTLTGTSGEITDFTGNVIRKSQEAGIHWVIATGRGFETVKPVLKAGKVNMDLILLNGTEYRSFDSGTRYFEAMDSEVCRKLILFFLENKIDIELNTSQGNYATAPRFLDASDDLLPFDAYDNNTDKVMKIFAFSKDIKRLEEAKKQLKCVTGIRMASSAYWNLELSSWLADKAKMLKRVANKMNIAEDEIMVFGDGENDKSLFENFRHSRAVANAVPEIRNRAEKIIESYDEDGVAKEVLRVCG